MRFHLHIVVAAAREAATYARLVRQDIETAWASIHTNHNPEAR